MSQTLLSATTAVKAWTNEMTDLSVDGFKNFALHRVKSANAKRDSGGVRNKYADFVSMHKSDSDDILWLKLSGHLLK